MNRQRPGEGSDHGVTVPDVCVLGVEVEQITAADLIDALLGAGDHRPRTVLYANPHVLNTAYRDERVRHALQAADVVYVDGIGVQFAAVLLGGRTRPRTTAADWIDRLCSQAAAEGKRLYLLAGATGVAEKAADLLSSRHPDLVIAGTHHGYIDETSSAVVVSEINRSGADLLLVGMGTPTQERWIARHRHELAVPVVWAAGAVLDFVAGVQPRAPRWMARNHLEWAWRLGTDPFRLWKRYVLGNPLFLARVLRQRLLGLPTHLRGQLPPGSN